MTNIDAGSAPWVDPDDAPELTDVEAGDVEVFDGNTFVRRGRGRPKAETAREQISVRLDADLLTKLREFGPGWQSQINPALRQAFGLGPMVKGRAQAERTELLRIREEVALLRAYVEADAMSRVTHALLMKLGEPDDKKVNLIREAALLLLPGSNENTQSEK